MTWLIYALAALAEIAGCFAFWAWTRLDRSPLWIAPGVVSLAHFAYLQTRVDSEAAGRAYAAYGGVYNVATIHWLWLVEHRTPDRAAPCLTSTPRAWGPAPRAWAVSCRRGRFSRAVAGRCGCG